MTSAIALLVFGSVVLLHWLGTFQSTELFVYDHLIRSRPHSLATNPAIAVIQVTEADVHKYDNPLPDEQLATLLEKIAAQSPRAIGVDLYRDLPEPRNGSGSAALQRVMAANPNIIWICKFGDKSFPGIPAPPFLRDAPDRISFNDFPIDEKEVRRGLLYLDDGKTTVESLSLKLAEIYLAGEKQPITPEPDPVHPEQLRLGRTTFTRLGPDSGGYVGADAAGYQFLMDFIGPRTFAAVSVDEFLTGKAPADFAKDRVVLLGSTAQSLNDFISTPVSFREPGVFLHAKTLDQILRAATVGDHSAKFWNAWRENGWLLFWCILGGLTPCLFPSPFRLTMAVSLSSLALCAAVWRAFAADWWIPLSPPLVGNLSSAALVMVYLSHLERKERGELMDLFKRNVSPQVADSLWSQRAHFSEKGRPLAQKLTATVLFTDLANFTTTSEGMDPAELMDWLNAYMNLMAAEVDAHGGVLMKYIGDAIMAVFGVPVARQTEAEIDADAVSAVRCALAMRAALDRLNAQRSAAGGSLTGMRVGILTGTVVAGCMGSDNRLEYTTLGDTVNTAARLESFDKTFVDPELPPTNCRILIGAPTQRRLGNQFTTKQLPDKELKGKTQATAIYWVVGDSPAQL